MICGLALEQNRVNGPREAFAWCWDLAGVTIPSSVTTIGDAAFFGCSSLISVTIPSGVTSIGGETFSGCANLTSVTIPSSVTSIEREAFCNCSSLTDVYYGGSEKQWEAITIYPYNNALTDATIHYNSPMPEVPAQPQQPDQPVGAQAMPTNDKLTSDGELQNPTVYKINDSNYFKIRDLAAILNGTEKQFAVGYDNEKQSVTAATGQAYTMTGTELNGAPTEAAQAEISNDVIYVDGEKVEAEVYKIGGMNYFKLRDLGKALNFYVGWTQEQGMYIDTSRPYAE